MRRLASRQLQLAVAALVMRSVLPLSLIIAFVSPVTGAPVEGAQPVPCVPERLVQSMTALSKALDAEPLRLDAKNCSAQETALVAIADKARARLTSNASARDGRRLAAASLGVSILAVLSAPLITLALFRRYGLISWRPPSGRFERLKV